MSNNQIFQKVRSLRPGRSVFDLSYSKLMTCDFGQLIPVMADEVYPGDTIDISTQLVIRMQPTVAPVMHEMYSTVHYFFVPNRHLWDDWEEFITGGVDGQFDETASPPPRWTPTDTTVGSLWDYFGFPVGVTPTGALPLAFPLRAYNEIYNEYYRDQNITDEIDLDDEEVKMRCWAKDYFASALPWQQRGIAPALPISGLAEGLVWLGTDVGIASKQLRNGGSGSTSGPIMKADGSTLVGTQNLIPRVDLSTASTFNVADLRLAFQIQKWMERNARAGARYTESLKAHFGVSNGDDRLQRPEYIGGCKFPIIVSEVVQTSSTVAGSPQGKLAGKGLTAGGQKAGKYNCTEHGWIIGIMSIMPVAMYSQGIDRQYLRRSRYDYYTPEFANLSEQAIERAEIYASAVEADNKKIFGYQGRFDEMRTKRNMVTGLFRTDYDYWHLGREFASAPLLNENFLVMDAKTGGAANPYKRIFAVPSEPGFIAHITNVVKAIRPMPIQSEPGLIDHA